LFDPDPNYNGTGAALAAEFFAFAVDVLAVAIEPIVRNAFIQNLATNFK
jgi:hypothetical protein